MNPTKILMIVALVLVIVAIVFVLMRRDRSSTSAINLEDLLIGDDGKLSKAAAVMMGAFAMTTWLMVYLALNGKMTEGYLAIYVGAWIAPTVTRLIMVKPPEA
jgi:preprotein translocase subunit SecG